MTSETNSQTRTHPPIRIGMLRLTDAAPLVMALEKGFFAARDLDVRLNVEPSWANVADKLTFGHLDAAVMLPPLALAMALGLRGTPSPIIVPMSLSLNGNSLTVSHEIADALGDGSDVMAIGHRFAEWLRTRAKKPRLAVVHVFSTHNLLLRYWLAVAGVDPDEDVEIAILPPAETAAALKAGEIDGFCTGAPWGSVAVAGGSGRTILVSSEIWRNHPEKCLAVGGLAERDPQTLKHVLASLLEAARYCDDQRNAAEIAAILARREYLDVDPAFIRASLAGAMGMQHRDVDHAIFAAHAANTPFRAHAQWFLSQMARWGYVSRTLDAAAVAQTVYRPDLLQSLTGAADMREREHFCGGVE